MWVVLVTTTLHTCVNVCHEPEQQTETCSSTGSPLFYVQANKIKMTKNQKQKLIHQNPTPLKVLDVMCSHVTLVHHVNPGSFITVNVDSAPE